MNDGLPLIDRIIVPESRLSNNGFLNMVYLLFGGSFLGIALFLIAPRFGDPVSIILISIGAPFLAVALGPQDHPIRATISRYAKAGVSFAVIGLIWILLAGLASNGVYGSNKSGAAQFFTEAWLVFGVVWLVFGVPYRAFKYQVDPQGEGKTQRVVLRLVVFGASILTGISFMLLHFDGGPFHNVNAYTLLAGVIFTIFLLAPGYRSVAKAGWTRPIYPVPLRSFAQHWSEAAEEVKIALRQRRAARRAQNSAMATGSRDSGNSHKYSPVRTSDDNRISTPRSNSNRPEKQAQDKGNARKDMPKQRPSGKRRPFPNRSKRRRRRKR